MGGKNTIWTFGYATKLEKSLNNLILKLKDLEIIFDYLSHVFYAYTVRCGRDRMVVGFTTTFAINAYHH